MHHGVEISSVLQREVQTTKTRRIQKKSKKIKIHKKKIKMLIEKKTKIQANDTGAQTSPSPN